MSMPKILLAAIVPLVFTFATAQDAEGQCFLRKCRLTQRCAPMCRPHQLFRQSRFAQPNCASSCDPCCSADCSATVRRQEKPLEEQVSDLQGDVSTLKQKIRNLEERMPNQE